MSCSFTVKWYHYHFILITVTFEERCHNYHTPSSLVSSSEQFNLCLVLVLFPYTPLVAICKLFYVFLNWREEGGYFWSSLNSNTLFFNLFQGKPFLVICLGNTYSIVTSKVYYMLIFSFSILSQLLLLMQFSSWIYIFDISTFGNL